MASSVSVQVPPSSNTGAQITAPSENRCIIDWFAFTVSHFDPFKVIDMMGLKRGLFDELERGGMGYKKSLRYGHITIFYDGAENMGCHVEMSGQGCRQYEAGAHSWIDLIALIQIEGAKLTRLDIAIDTVDGTLKLGSINYALRHGKYRSQFTKTRQTTASDMTADGLKNHSQTRYFGSGSSRVMFRVYDKAAQMGLETDWIRFEIQLRDERANLAADAILVREDLGNVATGIINQYLSFINLDDSNKSRCSLLTWWENWLQHTSKLKLTMQKAKKLVSEVQEYIKKQYAPTLAMIKKAVGVSDFSDFLRDVLDDGYKRMTTKHDQIILNSRLAMATDYPF